MADRTPDEILAEIKKLKSPEHRATFCNHIGPNVTIKRIRLLEQELERVMRGH